MYALFGNMRAQPGQRDALLTHLLEAAAMMSEVAGCYAYIVHSDPTDDDGIWVYEAWRSQDDHQASLSEEAVINLIAAARPLIAEMPQRYEVTPLGGLGLPDVD